LGTVKDVTVNQSCGKWYVSIQTADEITEPVHPSNLNRGIDAGVTQLTTQSDGTIYLPVNSFKSRQKPQISVRKDYLH
jgi:putative transposase